MTLLLLAVTFRKLLMMEETTVLSSPSNGRRETLIDRAFEIIQDEIEVDTLSITKLRQVLQLELESQAKVLLEAFRAVDVNLNLVPDRTRTVEDRQEQDLFYDKILRQELDDTDHNLRRWKEDNRPNPLPLQAPKGADPEQFFSLKLGALQTLLDRRSNSNNPPRERHQTSRPPSSPSSSSSPSWVDADEFGFHESPTDQRRNELIRHYQTINVCRNRELRKMLGYSVLALQSSIPGAGRGVYVDGYAPAGSILCFQPGFVWLKDHLLNMSIEEDREMTRNDAYQMSLRADDIIIDSRRSPYTVLTDDSSNMMAIGHIVNHPTATKTPNSRSAMFDFTSRLLDGVNHDDRDVIGRYIPNTYAKQPINTSRGLIGSLMDGMNGLGTDSDDNAVVEMHSMVLIATRDVCNEEIFYDYRLATSHLPSWYEPVVDTAYSNDGGDAEVEQQEESN